MFVFFQIIIGYMYGTWLEWALHKYILHGLGKNKKSWFNFHWYSHHKSCRKNKNFDIVHCRGVLSHTGNKRKAFKKICSYVKKGGYLIFGDTNKAGGFQNMLQRYILYKFSKNDEEIVKPSVA